MMVNHTRPCRGYSILGVCPTPRATQGSLPPVLTAPAPTESSDPAQAVGTEDHDPKRLGMQRYHGRGIPLRVPWYCQFIWFISIISLLRNGSPAREKRPENSTGSVTSL